jgi:N-hydroxyarylamine O-acetyltransferase
MSDAPDIDAYFRRVGFQGPAPANLETLQRLHTLHARAIPFENLSPLLGEPVKLDLASLEDKLLRSGRGGWCFEHNLLFSHVLLALGYDVARLAARVRWNVPAGVITSRSHMLMRVKLPQGEHIADVGFGGQSLTTPLAIAPGVEQKTAYEPHRITAADNGYVLETKIGGEWQALYAFDLAEQQVADYEVSNWYLCNHPESQFVKGIVAARAGADRRHALRNTRYAVHFPNGDTEKRFVGSVREFRELLTGPFGIRLPGTPGLDAKLERVIAAHPPTPGNT